MRSFFVPPLKQLFKSHFPFFLLLPYAAFMIFSGLGDSVLQMDEGEDTFIATTILKYGIPMHSDGVNWTMDFADIYDGVFVYRTWFPYYLQALSILSLGHTTVAARLPFAIIGFFSVCALYFLAFKLTGKKPIALLASFLLASSVPALVLMRTGRYFALPILFTTLMLYFYVSIFDKSRWRAVPFVIVSILFFHSMYVEFVSTSLGIVAHLLISRKLVLPENLKKAVFSFAGIALFTVPWLAFVAPIFSHVYHVQETSNEAIDSSLWGQGKHFLSLSFQLNNYIFPFILTLVLSLESFQAYSNQIKLLLCCAISIVLVATLHPIPSQFYITSCFPPLFILLAILVLEGIPNSQSAKVAFVAMLIATNILHVGPLLPLKPILQNNFQRFEKNRYLAGMYATFMREVGISFIYFKYWHEITHPYRGPLDTVVEFFKTHGKAGETCYITSEGDAFIYYTGMKLIRKKELSSESRPDWIVLRSGNIALETGAPPRSAIESRLRKIVQSNAYRKFAIDSPVDRINNAYEIQIHKFESPPVTDKITIYQLQKTETGQDPQ